MPLVPVAKITTHDLCSRSQEEIKYVVTTGYTIMAIISDNNVINGKMFIE